MVGLGPAYANILADDHLAERRSSWGALRVLLVTCMVCACGLCRIGERIQWCLEVQANPSPDHLPPKYRAKVDKLLAVYHKYTVTRAGATIFTVHYRREDGSVVSHTVNLALDRDTSAPLWSELCTCGKPWTRRYLCIHVLAACIEAKVRPLHAQRASFVVQGWLMH